MRRLVRRGRWREVDAVTWQAEVRELIENQPQRAPNRKEPAHAGRIEKAERKRDFKVVPNRGGLAPGVTAANLEG